MLIQAINTSWTTDAIISKCDILKTVGKFALYDEDVLIKFDSLKTMKNYISESIYKECEMIENIQYSSSLSGIWYDLTHEFCK